MRQIVKKLRSKLPKSKILSKPKIISPFYIRITHWFNALAIIIMVMSGWRIYDASPIFEGIYFPKSITLGGWLGGAIMWHFAAMWLLVINGLIYLIGNIVTGRIKTKFFPIPKKEFVRDVISTLKLKLAHADLSKYNTIQKLAYLTAMADIILLVLSGLAVWKPVQFPTLTYLLGGFDNARVVHFFAMCFIVFFFVVHVAMVALVPKTLLIMLRGR
jgi:thiosulfate reductase cytochrome b subunit